MSRGPGRVVLPYYLTPDHIIGLVEALSSLGGKADPMLLGDMLGERIDTLPLVIDVAQALGLVEVDERGDLHLTEVGRALVHGNIKQVKQILKSRAESVEPLGSILRALSQRRKISAKAYREILSNFYHRHIGEAEKNVLQWGAFLGLFKMTQDDEYIVSLR